MSRRVRSGLARLRQASDSPRKVVRRAPEIADDSGKSSSPRRLRERNLIATLAVCILVLAGFFASPMFRGRVPVHGDLGFFNLPIRDFYARCLRQGAAFDWTPQIFGGYFLTGEGQHGPYHPIHWLLYRWLPLDTAFALEVFLPVLMIAGGMVVFLRRYVNLAGALMGAMIAPFSAVFIVHLQQPQSSAVVAHIPWLLAAIDGAVRAPTATKRRLACVAIALLTGSQVLLGHPQSTWFSLLTGSLFGLYMLLRQRANWSGWVAVVGGISLGLCVAAVQLMSTYALFSNSGRAVADVSTLAYPVIDPRSFLGVIAPYKACMGSFPTYCGGVPLILVLWWAVAHRVRPENSQTPGNGAGSAKPCDDARRHKAILQVSLWTFLLAALTALLSMGIRGKLYYLQMLLPVVGTFRSPARYSVLTQISVAILAAIAFARLVDFTHSGQKTSWRYLALPWLAAAASVLMAVWFFSRGYNPNGTRFQAQLFTGPLFVGGAAAALTLAARGRQIGLVLLVLLTAIDLGVFNVGNPIYGKIYWRKLPTYEGFAASIPVPPAAPNGRVCHEGNPGAWVGAVDPLCLHGFRAINGYAGLHPRRHLDYRDLNTLRVAEVAWFWQPPNERALRVAGSVAPPNGGWCRIPRPLPRVRLLSRAIVSDTSGEDLKKIDVDTTALVSRPLELPPSTPGRAKLIEDRPGKISVDVEAPERQLLVLSESHNASWKVRIDGRPTSLERVNGDFIGCVVEGGEHRVEFTFDSATLRLGKIVSLAALAVVAAVVVVPGVRRPRRCD